MSLIDLSVNPTLNEIVSSLAARVNKQHDVAFMDELKHIVNYKRRVAIHEWILHMKNRDFLLQQYLINTERVSATECAEFDTSCFIVKTVCQVPSPYRDNRSKMAHEMFDYVGHESGYMPYSYMDRSFLTLLSHKEYTKSKKKWFFSKGYIYILNDKDDPPEPIMIRGIFEDALTVRDCDVCDDTGSVCEADDAPFPIPPELLDSIVKDILSTELRVGDIPREVDEEKDTIKVDSMENIVHRNT